MTEKSARMDTVSPVSRAVRPTATRAAADGLRPPVPPSGSANAAAPQSDVLAMAAAIASQPPPIDAGRVAALREKIASGDYSIQIAATALAIANALVAPTDL